MHPEDDQHSGYRWGKKLTHVVTVSSSSEVGAVGQEQSLIGKQDELTHRPPIRQSLSLIDPVLRDIGGDLDARVIGGVTGNRNQDMRITAPRLQFAELTRQ